jgi:hypothetical protein
MVGRGNSIGSTEMAYRELIEDAGQLNVKQSVDLQTNVQWLGNAKIRVNIDITNNGNSFYFGKLRSYITEIDSRWSNSDGNPYHFGFLDFALDKPILIFPGKTKSFSETWDGSQDHNGITFEDISQDNIIVISTVSHWIPHYRTGYESEQFTQKYFAFSVDQTAAAVPETV